MEKITSSVIICTRNRKDDLLKCLVSLSQQTQAPDELIIVDSSDNSLENQEQFKSQFSAMSFPYSKLVYRHTSPGLTYQRNVGATFATQDVLYYFDDDTELETDYLERMNTIFAQHSEFAGGMGCVTNMPSELKKNWFWYMRKLFLLPLDYSDGTFTLSGMPTQVHGTNTFRNVEVLGGCCMAYRAWVLKKHQFDETLKRYGYMEDCDFSRRVSYDAPLFYNPAARLQHFASPVSRDAMIDNRAMFIKNYSYLFFKNFYPRNRFKILAYAWSVTGLFVEALLTRNMNSIKGYGRGLKEYFFRE